MTPSPPSLCLAFALAAALAAQSPERTVFQPRLAQAESVLQRFYRGESLEEGARRVNALVDRYNALVRQRNDELDAARAQVERDLPLGPAPAADDAPAVRAYNERVRARNGAVARYNERARQTDADVQQARARVEAERQALKARSDAYAAFHDREQDLAFFTGLNRLLADVRAAGRARPDPDLAAALDRVRGYRRELARWAAGRQEAQEDGLVLVQAMVGDEPCCFIVDTGAQVVCLPGEIIEALGLAGGLGEETTLTLAGGQKLRGRSVVLPRVAAAGMACADVAGSAVPAAEVGIDGLLGQSFLKRFVYTIDERKPGKLILTAR